MCLCSNNVKSYFLKILMTIICNSFIQWFFFLIKFIYLYWWCTFFLLLFKFIGSFYYSDWYMCIHRHYLIYVLFNWTFKIWSRSLLLYARAVTKSKRLGRGYPIPPPLATPLLYALLKSSFQKFTKCVIDGWLRSTEWHVYNRNQQD